MNVRQLFYLPTGTITFVQEENKPWADTALFIEMSDAGETIQTTFNHNYHIHTNPVGNDYLAKTRRCASTGGHWNPFNAPVTGKTYYTDWFLCLEQVCILLRNINWFKFYPLSNNCLVSHIMVSSCLVKIVSSVICRKYSKLLKIS